MKSSPATWKWRSGIRSSQSPMKPFQFTGGDLSHGVSGWEHQTLQQMVKPKAIIAALGVPRYLYNVDTGLSLLNAASWHTGNLTLTGKIAFEIWCKKLHLQTSACCTSSGFIAIAHKPVGISWSVSLKWNLGKLNLYWTIWVSWPMLCFRWVFSDWWLKIQRVGVVKCSTQSFL